MASDRQLLVYVLASLPRDAELTCGHLHRAGVHAECTASFDELLTLLDGDVGALLLTEEAIPEHRWPELAAMLARQPTWSDVPVIVCARKGKSNVDKFLRASANMTVIETPVRVSTVISAAQAAVRARKRQYEMRDLLRRLEDTDRRKDEFLAMLGHELRNPLAAIQLAVQLKQVRSSLNNASNGHGNGHGDSGDLEMQVIERQLRTLGRIVDDLLDVSRITLGKIRLDIRDVDLCEVARRCVQALALEARASKLELSINTPAHPVLVRGDVLRLEQIASNLVTNAVKYTPAGGSVSVGVREEDQGPCLVVRDTGIGIEGAIMPKVFELFSQAQQGIARSRGGLGLGLALVKHLVELHDGTVGVTSEGANLGSTFTVRFPPAAAAVAQERSMPHLGAPLRDNLHIVVVEDNDDARLMLCDLLESRGQRVDMACDGLAGLHLARDRSPDVMLIDIGLPKLDGYQLASEIRKSVDKPPLLIAMTGYGHERDRALAAGFDIFMVKPIDVTELESTLARFRGRSTQAQPERA